MWKNRLFYSRQCEERKEYISRCFNWPLELIDLICRYEDVRHLTFQKEKEWIQDQKGATTICGSYVNQSHLFLLDACENVSCFDFMECKMIYQTTNPQTKYWRSHSLFPLTESTGGFILRDEKHLVCVLDLQNGNRLGMIPLSPQSCDQTISCCVFHKQRLIVGREMQYSQQAVIEFYTLDEKQQFFQLQKISSLPLRNSPYLLFARDEHLLVACRFGASESLVLEFTLLQLDYTEGYEKLFCAWDFMISCMVEGDNEDEIYMSHNSGISTFNLVTASCMLRYSSSYSQNPRECFFLHRVSDHLLLAMSNDRIVYFS